MWHHFLLIDALGKEDPSTFAAIPAMQPMAHYPRGSHWLAAGLGMLIGSPYAAMWLLGLLSVYVRYYALGRLAQLSGGYVALAAFAFLVLVLRSTGAMTGHEIIGNFFTRSWWRRRSSSCCWSSPPQCARYPRTMVGCHFRSMRGY